jgi:hypothetical protein
MTANLILSFTGEQKIADGLSNAAVEIVASETMACRRLMPFSIAHHSFFAKDDLVLTVLFLSRS